MCFIVVILVLWYASGFTCSFTHILQGNFTGTGAILGLPQCQWNNPEGCEYFSRLVPHHDKTQQSLNSVPGLDVCRIFYRPNFPNSAFSRSAYKEYRRKLCFNPLAWLVLLLALGCRAVKYVEPCHRYFWTHPYHGDIFSLTHWGRVMHIWVSKLTLLGSHNGLLPRWCQAIICTNAGILLTWNLGTKFNEISSEIHTFSFKKMSSGKWRPFCLSLNVLIEEMICW